MIELLRSARQRQRSRVPFVVGGRVVGSVATDHLPALRGLSDHLHVDEAVRWRDAPDRPDRDAALAQINAELRRQGLIPAWRDELFALVDPHSGEVLARIERASSRFWGTLTLGAHATGYVADADGRIRHLWIARRAETKATDPGRLDNLIGGGVPHHQSPREALLREAWEEAGLPPALAEAARACGEIELQRDIPEGLQVERLHAFDLPLPDHFTPRNQDGEVAEFLAMTPAEATAALPSMTVDSALVTLDFLLRHRLLDGPDLAALQAGLDALRPGR